MLCFTKIDLCSGQCRQFHYAALARPRTEKDHRVNVGRGGLGNRTRVSVAITFSHGTTRSRITLDECPDLLANCPRIFSPGWPPRTLCLPVSEGCRRRAGVRRRFGWRRAAKLRLLGESPSTVLTMTPVDAGGGFRSRRSRTAPRLQRRSLTRGREKRTWVRDDYGNSKLVLQPVLPLVKLIRPDVASDKGRLLPHDPPKPF
jgi:hypothetical protein